MTALTGGAPTSPGLPRLRDTTPAGIKAWADNLVVALERELLRGRVPQGPTNYAVNNATPVRTLDPTTATATQTAQVLAAVIQDLQKGGKLA